jgi:hypothetical protein
MRLSGFYSNRQLPRWGELPGADRLRPETKKLEIKLNIKRYANKRKTE